MKVKALLTALAGLAIATAAQAATVTYNLVINDNGTGTPTAGQFAVYATTSAGDNAGLVAFQFTVSGQASLSNQSPRVTFTGGPGDDITTGFTALRSSGASGVATKGSFDTASGAPYIAVYGIGQNPDNLLNYQPSDYPDTSGATRTAYSVPVLLATGTYTSTVPTIVANNTNVWQFARNGATEAATTLLATTTTLPVVPEPTSLAAIGLVGAGLISRRRKA